MLNASLSLDPNNLTVLEIEKNSAILIGRMLALTSVISKIEKIANEIKSESAELSKVLKILGDKKKMAASEMLRSSSRRPVNLSEILDEEQTLMRNLSDIRHRGMIHQAKLKAFECESAKFCKMLEDFSCKNMISLPISAGELEHIQQKTPFLQKIQDLSQELETLKYEIEFEACEEAVVKIAARN